MQCCAKKVSAARPSSLSARSFVLDTRGSPRARETMTASRRLSGSRRDDVCALRTNGRTTDGRRRATVKRSNANDYANHKCRDESSIERSRVADIVNIVFIDNDRQR